MTRKIASMLAALVLVFALSAFSTVFAAEANYPCTPAAETTGDSWAVGKNAAVTPTTGSGFKILSKNGTAPDSNIVWAIPIAQLKKTPYFVINVANTGSKTDGPYMRLIYSLDGEQNSIVNPDFKDPNLENWVRANAKTGLHCFNLLEQLPKDTKDDARFLFVLYQDPFETGTAVEISELYLSATEVKAGAEEPASSAAASSEAPSSASAQEESKAEASSRALDNTSSQGENGSSNMPVIIGVIIVAAIIIIPVVMKKKKDGTK